MSYDDYGAADTRSLIRPPRSLVGSKAQVEWANRIYSEHANRFGADRVPGIDEARFWIDNRDCTTAAELEVAGRLFIAEQDANWESPFTFSFPRYTREDARGAMAGLRRLAASVGVIVLDLETTGLEKTARVVEIAAVRWPSRAVVVDAVVRPPDGMEPAEISDITPLEFAAAPPFAEIADDVVAWATQRHLVSWNTRFDVPVLRRELAHASLAAPQLRATCAMRLASAWLDLDSFPSLEEALERMAIKRLGTAHRAMGDALSTCALLDAMAEADT